MKLHGPRPVSELTSAMKANGTLCDTGSVRCEIILTGDGEMLCWRAWGRESGRWVATRWKSPTDNIDPSDFAGGAA